MVVPPATSKTIGMIFDHIFPYHVRLGNQVRRNDAIEWLELRVSGSRSNGSPAGYTWRAQREVGFIDPKLAVEFKLIFG